MSHGGKREGAGRKVGTSTKKTREIADAAMAAGITPLEFMLQILRDPLADWDKRLDAAKSAAPYCHPRLTSIANTNDKPFKVDSVIELIVVHPK